MRISVIARSFEKLWRARRDSNLRRLGGVSEAGASCRNPERREGSGVKSELLEEGLARPERFELPTYSSGGCRSIQLSYGRAPNFLSLQPLRTVHQTRSPAIVLRSTNLTWFTTRPVQAPAIAQSRPNRLRFRSTPR